MTNFDFAIAYTLQNEGGFGHDVNGPVNAGLLADSIASYRNVPVDQITESDVENLKLDEIQDIYKHLFWYKNNIDKINDISIATAIFDIGVNIGFKNSITLAQEAASTNGPSLEIDGIIGHHTIWTINSMTRNDFLPMFCQRVKNRYESIVNNNPEKYGKYLTGWRKRANRLMTLL